MTLTKQDIQNAIDVARNRIMARMATRQDVQIACDATRDRVLSYIHDVQQQQLQLTRQTNIQMLQFARRAATFETRIANIEQDLKNLVQLLQRLVEQGEEQKIPRNVAIRALRSQYSF
jgi:hypothetical protein